MALGTGYVPDATLGVVQGPTRTHECVLLGEQRPDEGDRVGLRLGHGAAVVIGVGLERHRFAIREQHVDVGLGSREGNVDVRHAVPEEESPVEAVLRHAHVVTDGGQEVRQQRHRPREVVPERHAFQVALEVDVAVALRNPERYRTFLDHVSRDWSEPLTQRFTDEGMAPDVAAARATLLVAAGRGLIIDRLAGGDDARISGSLDALVDLTEAWSGEG